MEGIQFIPFLLLAQHMNLIKEVNYFAIDRWDILLKNGKLLSDKWLLEYNSDKWLIRMGQPITVRNGYMNVDIATSINSDGTHNYSIQKINTSSDQKHFYSKIQRNFDIKDNINLKIGLQFDLNYGNSSSNHAKSEIQFNYNF